MSIKGIIGRVTSFGTDQFQENMDEDHDRARFIKNRWLRAVYLLLFNVSTYLLAFEIGYLTFTRQLESVDIFAFLAKGMYIAEFVAIILFAVSIQLIKDKLLDELESKSQRKSVTLLVDCLRLVTYTLTYLFFSRVLIGKQKKMHLVYSSYILLTLLVLFYARKIFFWALFIGKQSQESMKLWERRETKNKLDKTVQEKVRQLNTLIQRLQKIKQKMQIEEGQQKKNETETKNE